MQQGLYIIFFSWYREKNRLSLLIQIGKLWLAEAVGRFDFRYLPDLAQETKHLVNLVKKTQKQSPLL